MAKCHCLCPIPAIYDMQHGFVVATFVHCTNCKPPRKIAMETISIMKDLNWEGGVHTKLGGAPCPRPSPYSAGSDH